MANPPSVNPEGIVTRVLRFTDTAEEAATYEISIQQVLWACGVAVGTRNTVSGSLPLVPIADDVRIGCVSIWSSQQVASGPDLFSVEVTWRGIYGAKFPRLGTGNQRRPAHVKFPPPASTLGSVAQSWDSTLAPRIVSPVTDTVMFTIASQPGAIIDIHVQYHLADGPDYVGHGIFTPGTEETIQYPQLDCTLGNSLDVAPALPNTVPFPSGGFLVPVGRANYT